MEENYLEINALKVTQPLGNFYAISIPAKQLLEISFSEPLRYVDNEGKVQGSQRVKDVKRLKDIAKYIDSVEMAFPNSIILSANYTPQGGITKDPSERWRIIEESKTGICKLIIPKKMKLAAIIDGQHRLNAFDYVTNEERFSNLQLICSVYFDLPNSYQAFLFATINSNQKRVNRSLALEQFGYNVDDEPEKAWTPEKFAVFLSRKLNIDKENSPLYQHIRVEALDVEKLFDEPIDQQWVISTATIVDGICSLISSNPKRDRIVMQQKSFLTGRSRDMIASIRDYSPLRNHFIAGQDQTIYDTIINYLKEANKYLWQNASGNSYIIKTIGLQAAFDILKFILRKEKATDPTKIDFESYLKKAKHIDFSDRFFQASGIGRSRIRNSIAVLAELIEKSKLKKSDLPYYEQIFSNENTGVQKEKWVWEDEAENAVASTLEKAEWNFGNNTVGLYIDENSDEPTIFVSYDDLFKKLVEIAEAAFAEHLPLDNEFNEQQNENFDAEDLVNSSLVEYESNLERLKWT
ncbi:MAG: DNA phosphorothioation-associated DGQHR protein 1 [Chitinophagaceae bacterium]|nr:DNA phosphorothioation-associated DGQHR protein 1 [Chitinophagaceae bacterium]